MTAPSLDTLQGQEQLRIDIATLLARLVQLDGLRDDCGHFDLPDFIWQRVMTCDVPRLRGYLDGPVAALLDQVIAEGVPRDTPDGP